MRFELPEYAVVQRHAITDSLRISNDFWHEIFEKYFKTRKNFFLNDLKIILTDNARIFWAYFINFYLFPGRDQNECKIDEVDENDNRNFTKIPWIPIRFLRKVLKWKYQTFLIWSLQKLSLTIEPLLFCFLTLYYRTTCGTWSRNCYATRGRFSLWTSISTMAYIRQRKIESRIWKMKFWSWRIELRIVWVSYSILVACYTFFSLIDRISCGRRNFDNTCWYRNIR